MSELLQEAKCFLAKGYTDYFGGKTPYICNAAKNSGDCSNRVEELMHTRLGDYYTVESFLNSKPKIFKTLCDLNYQKKINQVQKYRHRWID